MRALDAIRGGLRTAFGGLARPVGEIIRRGAFDRAWLHGLQYDKEMSLAQIEREPYKFYSWLQIAIYKKAAAFASCEFKVMRGEDEVTDHPIVKLFRDVNPWLSRNQFFQALCIYFNLKGEFFVYFPPTAGDGTSYGLVPSQMFVLEPQYMHIVQDRDGQLLGWAYKPMNGKALPLIENKNIIHLARFNPYNQLRGLAAIDALKMGMRIDIKAAMWNEAFFDNNAVPETFLVYPESYTLDAKEVERLRKEMKDKYGGARKGHQLGILSGGVDVKTLGLSQKDMEFLSTREFSREELLAVLELPKALLSITDDLNYATLQGLKASFWHEVIIPFSELVRDKLNSEVFPVRAPELHCEFDTSNIVALQDDMGTKIDRAVKLSGMGFTGNEINKALSLGFEEKPWRDKWWVQFSMVPVDEKGQGTPGGDGTPQKLLPARIEAEVPFPKSNFPTEDLRVRLWREFDARLRPVDVRFESKTSAYFFAQRRKILSLLDKGTVKARSENDVLNFQWDEEKQLFVQMAMPYETEALGRGIEMAMAMVNGTFSVDHPEAVAWLAQKMNKITGIVDTVKGQVRDELVQGITKGETVQEMADRIRGVYNFATSRSRTIARTETGGAFNAGVEMSYRNNGVENKEWLTARDPNVRDTHQGMDGQIVGIADKFETGGGVFLLHPGDPEGPAEEIISCRCLELPVVEK